METVLTLVAGDDALTDADAARIGAAIRDLGGDVGRPVWLSANRALDLPFALLSPDQATAAARLPLTKRPVDVMAQPTRDRRKALLLADMDSTMVIGETLDDLAEAVGLKDEIAAVTARAMNGEIDFAQAFRQRIRRLAGLSATALETAAKAVRTTPGAAELVATMRANGALTVLVSGGLRIFTRHVASRLGFDREIGNDVVIADGHLSGAVVPPILDRDAKGRTLVATAAEFRLPLSRTLAVGDGANDLGMIGAAGLGVAFHGKPMVAEQAPVRIDHGDLRSLLYFQGYADGEIAGG